MRIKLIRPNYGSHLITPPLGMGYLSSYLKSKGYDVEIIDGLNLGLTNDEIVKLIKKDDVVGIFCMSSYFLNVMDLCKKIKKSKGNIIVIGGPHASTLPAETLRMTNADAVIRGEGEVIFYEFLEAIKNKRPTEKIDGVHTNKNKRKENLKRQFIKDLDSLPFPDWKQIDPRTYKKAPHGAFIKNFPVAPITSTRGCPFECTFCASPNIWGKSIRYRSPKNVVDEIEYLTKKFGVKEIHFEDDNLTLKRSHIVEICNEILKRGIKVSMACPNGVRADKLDRELLKLMKKAGFYYIAFGVESGNQKILDNIKKHTTLSVLKKTIEMTEEEGIMTQGFFIFGLPGETKETVQETIDFAKNSRLSRAQFLMLDVIPGSELWSTLDHKSDWTKDSFHDVTWCPPTIDLETLQNAPSRAFKSFFLRPKQIWSLVKYFKMGQLPFLIKRLMDFKIIRWKK